MMNPIRTAAALLAATLSTAAMAQQPNLPHNGDHPAIVVQRLQGQAGYDYAAKFYPHPAWLYLQADAPRPMSDHPAVIVWRTNQAQQRELLARAVRLNGGTER